MIGMISIMNSLVRFATAAAAAAENLVATVRLMVTTAHGAKVAQEIRRLEERGRVVLEIILESQIGR